MADVHPARSLPSPAGAPNGQKATYGSDVASPDVAYTRTSDGVNIAYQVVGDGPLDLVLVPGWISHLDMIWQWPPYARWLRRLASFSRLILFDKRGMGVSDRPTEAATLEERIDDLRAVMDAVESRSAALWGYYDGAAMCALFAATYPQRTSALVLSCAAPAGHDDDELHWLPPRDRMQRAAVAVEAGHWGDGESISRIAPSVADDERFREWWARFERSCASPAAVLALQRMVIELDIRHVLPTIRVPTLVLERDRDVNSDPRSGRYIVERIPGARHTVVPGVDSLPFVGDGESLIAAVEEFLTGRRGPAPSDRVLATVLFTDIVASTERAAAEGDVAWRRLLDDHDQIAAEAVARWRGRLVKTTGDGMLATFDGPVRAIRGASELREDLAAIGLEIRAGLHTGEVEIRGDDVGGIAVHIGARVADRAGAGEVLVSRTVKDLVAGSGVEFEDRGVHELKGVPDAWQLFSVVSAGIVSTASAPGNS